MYNIINPFAAMVKYNAVHAAHTRGLYIGWLIKNVPNFAVMLYCLTVEFKQKEMTVLKSNHS